MSSDYSHFNTLVTVKWFDNTRVNCTAHCCRRKLW